MKFAVIFCTIFFAASLPEYQTRKTTPFHRSMFGLRRGSSRRGCHCPRIYLPECGANGRTYWNSCLRQCHDVPFAYDGSCYPEPMSLPPPLPPPTPPPPMIIGDQSTCYCAQIYLPECGVDGKTYSNSCLRKCDGISFAHEGSCDSSVPISLAPIITMPSDVKTPNCICPRLRFPECGEDGKSYENACIRECHNVAFAHQGACGALPLPKPGTDCGICPKIYIPECGGDGVTYANSCLRECKDIALAHSGVCEIVKGQN